MTTLRIKTLSVIFIIFLAAVACTLPNSAPTPTVDFERPQDFFGTPLPSKTPTPGPPTNTSTPYPTPTPRSWAQPYFGTPGPTQITPIPNPAPLIYDPEDFTVVLLGSDRRKAVFATDVILVINFQPKYNAISMLSIPRAMLVYIPGWQMNKVNLAFQHGEYGYYPGLGPALLKDTLEYNLGIEVDRYMLVDFSQFESVVDAIGGVDVPVACPYTDWRLISPELDPEDEDNWALYTVPSGVIHMDGDLTLWYARSRKKSSDADRNRRQQEVIRALYSQALRLEMVARIPALYSELSGLVTTDFTLIDGLTLAPQVANLSGANISSYYIDSRVLTRWNDPAGRDLLVPNQTAIQAMVAEAFGPPPEEQVVADVTVQIWNGTTAANLDVLAAERLNYAGYLSQIGVPDESNVTRTLLYDFTANGSPEDAAALRALFDLDEDQFAAVPAEDADYDFLLILGTDFDPCFDPKDVDR